MFIDDDSFLEVARWAEMVRHFGRRHQADPPEDDGYLKPQRDPYWVRPERYQLAKTVGLVSGQ